MLKLLAFVLLGPLSACTDAPPDGPYAATAGAPVPAAHDASYESKWTDILRQAVTSDGLVRYDLIGGPLRTQFDEVVASIESFDAGSLTTDAQKLAFWMNAYNVKMVERVLAEGTPANIERAGFEAFFKTPDRVAGREMTLDEIEHVVLRRQEGPAALNALQVRVLDPRIHVGLNCGAVSCPRLRSRAFTPENVDAELDRAMRDFVNNPRHFRVEGETIVVSSLLDWFADDWGAAGAPAGDYLRGFMRDDRPDAARLQRLFGGRSASAIKAQPSVRFEYTWDLNAARD